MAQAGTATVKFVGDYSQMNAGLASALAPAKLKGSGMKAGLAVGGAFAAAFVGSKVVSEISKAVDVTKIFDKEMSSLKAVAGATGREMDALRKQAIKMGAATVFSATEAAKAQTELAKGGLSASQILGGALKSSLDLAAAGELDLADAAETVVNSMQLFGLEGRATTRIADMLATAANRTTADVLDFAMSLKQGGAVAKTAGYSLNDTVVILEALAEAGIKNSDAGTSMKASLIQLLNPTKKQAKLAGELGISWLKQNGELKNGIQISKTLRKATLDMTKAERTKTFAILAGTDGFRTLSALYDAGARKLRNYSVANQEAGTAAETARTKTDNLSGDIEELSGAYETLQITVGTLVTPVLREVTQLATDATRKVNDFLSSLDKEAIGGKSWLELADGVFETGKAFAQFPFDPDGGAKRFINAITGDSEEVSRIQATIRARMDSAASLRRVSVIAKNARGRAIQATRAEKDAEADLRNARKRFGDGSNEVLRAEVRLQQAKRRTIRLTREAKRAEQLQGVERKVVASRTRDQVVQEKSRIVVLNRQVRALGRQWEAEKRNNGNSKLSRELEEKIIAKLKQREGTQKRLNDVLADASRQIGPKFAKSLQNISGKAATMEAALGRLPSPTRQVRSALGQLPPKLKLTQTGMEDLQEASGGLRRIYSQNMRQLPKPTRISMRDIQDSLAENLEAIQNTGKPQKKRRGGLVGLVRQAFRNGGVPVALSSGEMFKTPDGGMGIVPGRPTAADNVLTSMPVGTKIFTFDGQRRLAEGASEAQALRDQAPHFAKGGIVKPEVVGGTKKSAEVANAAISKVHSAASNRLKRAKKAAAAVPQGGNWHGGSGQYPGVSGDTDFIPALGQALSAMSKAAGTSIYVNSGWRSYAEQAALYAAYLNGTGNLAAPPGSSNHEDGRAADINPGSEVFGGMASRLGLGFTVPGESWHIELLRRGGIVGLIQSLYSGGQVKVVKDVGRFLMQRGFDHRATAGILGNAYREGLWNPSQLEYGNSNNGGLYGFTTSPVSLAEMKAFAARRGKPWDDAIVQTNFMLSHGNPPGIQLKGILNANETIAESAEDFMRKWERPRESTAGLAERVKAGHDASKIMRDAGIGGDEGGTSKRQRNARQSKNRREAREAQLERLRKRVPAIGAKSGLFNVIRHWAQFGDLDRDLKDRIAEAVRAAAGTTNPLKGGERLARLDELLERKSHMTGDEDGDDHFLGRINGIIKRSTKRGERKRGKLLKGIERRGLDYPLKGSLLNSDNVIKSLDEWIDLAGREHTSPTSAPYPDGDGSEYTDAEVDYEKRLNLSLLDSLRDRRDAVMKSLGFVTRKRDEYQGLVKQASGRNSPLRWKLPAFRKGLTNSKTTLGSLTANLEDLVGVTGQGGRIADVKFTLEELGVRDTFEKTRAADLAQGISIQDLQRIVEFAGLGGYNNLPKFHGGGIFKAPPGQTEGPALLKHNETIRTPEQERALASDITVVVEDGAVDQNKIKVLIGGEIVEHERRRNLEAKAAGL